MRNALAATLAVTAGLVAANMLGVAAAEAPTGTAPERTVGVQGVASVPIAQDANLEVATAAYRQGMADAVADAQSKAEFLAGKVAVTLGPVQSVAEDGGSISCTTPEGEELRYAEYEGERPDFGSGGTVSVGPAAAAAPGVAPLRRRKTAKRRTPAKKAAAVACKLEAQVSLVYAIA